MDYKSGDLRVVPTAYPEQFWIKDIVEPAPDKGYIKNIVSFSGYFGSYGPQLFAAAPEMFEALEWIAFYARIQIKNHPDATDTDGWRKIVAALEKARGDDKSEGK